MQSRSLAVLAVVVFVASCREATEPGGSPGPVLGMQAPGAGWVPIRDMMMQRQQHASVTGGDGRIYVIEGVVNTWVNGSEVYDPLTDAWTAIASPGGWCCGGAARAGDSRIYLVGGERESGGITTAVQVYDPGADSWSAAPPISISRYVTAVTAGLDGRIYVMGGTDNGDSRRTLMTGEVFDPTAGAWAPLPPMSTPRWYHAAATGTDGRVYVFGGLTGFTSLSSAEVYDPATNQWSAIPPMPQTWYAHAAATGSDGRIYLMGGVVNDGGVGMSVLAYDPVAGSWTAVPSLNAGRTQLAATAGLNGRIYASGGYNPGADDVTFSAESYATGAVNAAPFAVAGLDQTLACLAGGALVALDASGSSDPDNDPLTYQWLEGPTVLATSATASVRLARGPHALTLRVTDDEGEQAEDDLMVTIEDQEPPRVGIRTYHPVLWPPDGRLHKVARVHSVDECEDPAVTVTVAVTPPPREYRRGQRTDWKVVANEDGSFDVWVRAELERWWWWREYTITATAEDPSAHTASASTRVLVPLFWKHKNHRWW